MFIAFFNRKSNLFKINIKKYKKPFDKVIYR